MAEYCEPAPVVELMAFATGYPLDELQRLTSDGPHRGVPKQFLFSPGQAHGRSSTKKRESRSECLVGSYCPECLHESFYLRRRWRLAFYCWCPFHRRELIDACPQCGTGLDFVGRLMSGHPTTAGTDFTCQRCGFDLVQAPRNPAGLRITPNYLRFQRFIVAFGALQTPNASWSKTSKVFRDLCALIGAIAASDVSLLAGEVGLPQGSFPQAALNGPDKNTDYNLCSCTVRHLLFHMAHLCLERRLPHRATHLQTAPKGQIDALAAALSSSLLELVLLDFPEFLAREDVLPPAVREGLDGGSRPSGTQE